MTASTMSLEELQRTMAAAVMMPLTSDEEMQAVAPDGRAMSDVAEGFVAPNSRLSAFERLEIYNRQYWFRVLSALAEDFPALRRVLGENRFHALSVAYLTAHPSRSFSLRNLGSKLAEWLAANPQFAGRRSLIAVDVARVEWAFVEAFDSAEETPLTLEQIGRLGGDSYVSLQPHVQLLELEYPADELALRLHDGEKKQTSEAGIAPEKNADAPVSLREVKRRKTWVAAHRVDMSVYYRRLAREEYATLAAFRDGQTLADALASAFVESAMPERNRAGAVQKWFASWAELGWICAARP